MDEVARLLEELREQQAETAERQETLLRRLVELLEQATGAKAAVAGAVKRLLGR